MKPAGASEWRCFFEGEPGDTQVYTYLDLLKAVKKAANVLIKMGVEPGDRVAIYMPMIPEAIIAMQAVARIGAVHSVVFGGFSADSLASRIQDAGARSSSRPTAGSERARPAP